MKRVEIIIERRPELLLLAFLLLQGMLLTLASLVPKHVMATIALTALFGILLFWGTFFKIKSMRLFTMSIAIYCLLTFTVFPIIYAHAINNDSSSIEVSVDVARHEKKRALQSLNQTFTEKQRVELKTIKTILASNNPILDATLGLVSVDIPEARHYKALIGKISLECKDMTPPQIPHTHYPAIACITADGLKLFELKTTDRHKPIRFALLKRLNELQHMENNFYKQRQQMNRGKFWNSANILPYTLYESELITYKRPFTILLHAIHIYICNGIILAVIASCFYDYLNRKRPSGSHY